MGSWQERGCFPAHLCLPSAHTPGHPWEMPNEQGTRETQPPGSPVELGRPWIPQGSGPSKSSPVLPLAGPAVITRMPFLSPRYESRKEAYRSRSMTFLIVSKPGTPGRVRAYSLLLLPARWLPETGRANFTARRRLWGWHTPASGTFIPWHLDGSASFPEGKASEPRARPSSGMGGRACWLPSDEGGSLSGCGSTSFLP